MTPEWAREIYYAAFYMAYCEHKLDWTKPVIQHECELEAWKAVLDDPDTPEAKKALQAFLDAKADLRSSPVTVQRLWQEYTEIVWKEMEFKEAAKPRKAIL